MSSDKVDEKGRGKEQGQWYSVQSTGKSCETNLQVFMDVGVVGGWKFAGWSGLGLGSSRLLGVYREIWFLLLEEAWTRSELTLEFPSEIVDSRGVSSLFLEGL